MNRLELVVVQTVCCLLLFASLSSCNKSSEELGAPPEKVVEEPVGAPKMVLDKTNYNFGTVKQGQTATTQITVKNQGDGPLELESISASCGCTATSPSTRLVAPGQSAVIDVNVDTTGRDGAFRKTVTVESNDPDNLSVTVAITGSIQRDVIVEPANLHMGDVIFGEEATKEITITINEPDKVKLLNASVMDQAHFKLEKISELADGVSKWNLKFLGARKLDLFKSRIRLTLSGSAATRVEHSVYAKVVSDLRYPKLVFFRKVKDKFLERKITVASRTGAKVEISKIEDTSGLLELNLLENGKKDEKVIIANVKDQNKKYNHDDEHIIKLHTADKNEPIAEVTYSLLEKPIHQFDRPPPAASAHSTFNK